MFSSARVCSLALLNPRPAGAESTLTGSVASSFQAEPAHETMPSSSLIKTQSHSATNRAVSNRERFLSMTTGLSSNVMATAEEAARHFDYRQYLLQIVIVWESRVISAKELSSS